MLHFDLGRRHGLRDSPLQITACIDSVPLTELIDTFEIGAGMQPAGGMYGGLIPGHHRFGPMTDHFSGRSTSPIPLLACECGDVACWPLTARITLTGGLVVWDSFAQPHRKQRDYTTFGPFLFDRRRYTRAVRNLSATVDFELDQTRDQPT